MNLQQINLKQIIPTVLICGLCGGGLLILSSIVSTKGWWSMLIYLLVLTITVLTLKAKKHFEITYLKAFIVLVLTFMIMSYILYFYVTTFVNPDHGISFIGHAWRFFAMLGMAVASGAIMALFFRKQNQNLTQVNKREFI